MRSFRNVLAQLTCILVKPLPLERFERFERSSEGQRFRRKQKGAGAFRTGLTRGSCGNDWLDLAASADGHRFPQFGTRTGPTNIARSPFFHSRTRRGQGSASGCGIEHRSTGQRTIVGYAGGHGSWSRTPCGDHRCASTG
jgi:hypothetical protein